MCTAHLPWLYMLDLSTSGGPEVNKFNQVSIDGQQVSLAWREGQGQGVPEVPCPGPWVWGPVQGGPIMGNGYMYENIPFSQLPLWAVTTDEDAYL